jgi:drug/metabolite transporter (DMT)-like permease
VCSQDGLFRIATTHFLGSDGEKPVGETGAVVVVVLSLLAASAFGASVALQAHEATEVAIRSSLRFGLLASLATRPLWLIGLVGDIAGFVLQTAALSFGSLVVVQPLLTLGLIVALGVGARLAHRALQGWEWRAVAGVLGGLVVFYVAARPTTQSDAVASARGWSTVGAILGVSTIALLAIGRGSGSTTRAVMFGAAAGCAEAVMAVVSKAFGDRLGGGVVGTLASWEPYVLIVCGILTLLIVQSAYQLGRSTVTLPVITVSEPMVSMLVGAFLFGEHFHLGIVRVLLTVAGLGLVVRSLVVLARDPALAPTRQDGKT